MEDSMVKTVLIKMMIGHEHEVLVKHEIVIMKQKFRNVIMCWLAIFISKVRQLSTTFAFNVLLTSA